ncbi:metallophosphoesterase family protein [Micromonospora sp. WMMD1120]|uniref:purple acid phosphatase family protein n=1 Tax=Micromonospora sp. WMMD1120 TaxID=3016106 RepID=UPI00241720EE|nr:metallophosphoesterase family protein [Micromonospora sp. WMMD1120]MDG4806762.1 metallophosphoesterase family protein [Micromonospora sp. WMMD1120]
MTLSTSARASGLVRRRLVAGVAAGFLGMGAALGSGLTVTASAAESATISSVILGVGANETQRIVTWYSSADTAQKIQLAPTAEIVNGEFPAGAITFDAVGAANTSTTGFNRHATISNLRENTAYSYRVGAEGSWSPTYAFKTRDFEGDYDFLFFGDPQIGSSGDRLKDQAGWEDTLKVATAANPNAELLVSGGDHVESANDEGQWTSFMAPDQLRQYPVVATIGNHDVGGKSYEQHHFTPNTDRTAPYYDNGNPAGTKSGGDYWFVYKDVLFIDINSNSYKLPTDGGNAGDAAHVAYITDVVNKHGSEAKWKVLVYHHSIYSPASHATDTDNKQRREDFTTAFSNLGIDMVLQGHDHSYSRSYSIKNGQKENPAEKPGAADVFPGPGGVIYVTANSASGSKYYDIKKPDGSGTGIRGNGPDPLDPDKYWYNSVQNQEHVRSYVKVQVRGDKLVLANIRSGTCAAPNASVENGLSCVNTPEGQPVGSIVDNVTVHPYHGDGQAIQVNVPNPAPGEFGWTIDGYNGLVDLGTAQERDGTYFQATGKINPILVSDSRRSLAPWSISANVGDFSDAEKTFSGSYLGWTPYVLDTGAGAEAGAPVLSSYDDQGKGLSVSSALGAAAQGHPRGGAKLGADLDLKIPDSIAKGSYRTTLTITALSS